VELRNFLFQFVVTKFRSQPHFVKMKTAKTLVEIAKIEWPELYADFYSQTVTLAVTPDTCPLALTLILLVSEDYVGNSIRESPSTLSGRRDQLKSHVISHY
jgi:hypothetical protein